ncbi:MAG: ABC transporter ATP-binding protein [Thermoguttaceae bacterium]|nr:ABC transporter ATP-binding protein [Thermoguttaceae bacterium]MBR6480896.1 ABC transporter ATP-binding protein [Thermoguttaceae bacterium]
MIHLEKLTKTWNPAGSPALDAISVDIHPGCITGLVGPDGAGKTTLLRILAGLLQPSEGSAAVFGFDATRQTDDIKPFLGYMPQKFGLYEDLTVMENLELYAKLRGLPKSERTKKLEELLQFTSLTKFTGRLARRLSGGMKQKLGLACALITTPRLLLLDEPGVGVDPISRRELWRMVRELVRDDVAVVWSTAYLDEAELCDEVLLLNAGKKLYFGPPSGLIAPMNGRVVQVHGIPEHRLRPELARFLQNKTVRDGVIQGNTVRLVLDTENTEMQSCRNSPFAPYKAEPVSPSFEDGFIDRLGGIVQRKSPLARDFHLIPTRADAPVVADGLTKRYGAFTAADHITFTMKQGEILGLLGPNGAGKSTTFKMLCGLLRPTEGVGYISGWDLRKSPSRARARLGYMAQKFSLYPDLSVRQNLKFYAGIYGLRGTKHRKAVDQMISLFELGEFADVSSGRLPLGFKQRLSLAAALMHEPDVLFLDEPTSGVDPLTRREFWSHINALVEKGVTILVTTHFMDEAEYCDRILLINAGRMAAEGTPGELKARARSADLPAPSLEDAFIRLVEEGRNTP